MSYIFKEINEAIEVHQRLQDDKVIDSLEKIAAAHVEALKNGNKVLIFGNGGSAADSVHIAAELVGRFQKERRGLPAISLAANISNLTAIGNDYGYSEVFIRQVEALGAPGDIAFGLSASGNSENVLKALSYAKGKGLITVGFTGEKECLMDKESEFVFHAPSSKTARIQECHILAIHIICGIIEDKMFS